jgi:hypothetical protein
MFPKILLTFAITTALISAMAQAPQLMNYQAVVRDAQGNPKTTGTVGVRYSIRDLTPTGTVVYQQSSTATPNQFGIITVVIGGGNLSTVNWGTGAKYLEVELDINNTSNFVRYGYLAVGKCTVCFVCG